MDLGKIMPLFKGTYDDTVEYEILDIVRCNNMLYIAKGTVINVAPTGTETDNDKWKYLLGNPNIIDSELSATSENAIANKTVTNEFEKLNTGLSIDNGKLCMTYEREE